MDMLRFWNMVKKTATYNPPLVAFALLVAILTAAKRLV